MTAREYWEQRFGKEPKTDMDRLAVAFASEYGRVAYNQAIYDAAENAVASYGCEDGTFKIEAFVEKESILKLLNK